MSKRCDHCEHFFPKEIVGQTSNTYYDIWEGECSVRKNEEPEKNNEPLKVKNMYHACKFFKPKRRM